MNKRILQLCDINEDAPHNNLGAGVGTYGLGVEPGGLGLGNTSAEMEKGPSGSAYSMNDYVNTIDKELEKIGVIGKTPEHRIRNFRKFIGLKPNGGWTNKVNRALHKFKKFRKSLNVL